MSHEFHDCKIRTLPFRVILLAGVASSVVFAGANAQEATPPPVEAALPFNPSVGFAEMVAAVTPAVVSIRVRSPAQENRATAAAPGQPPTPFPQPDVPETRQQPYVYGQGSGFFISADGFVVTNNHVVENADMVRIVLTDGTEYSATVIGTDPRTDLALLKVDGEEPFPFVTFSTDEARVGDWAIAVGNPFGLGGSVTAGIVSALGRDIGAGPYDDFIQVDASINRGNSGGPVFNGAGEVIGVNSAIYSPTGASVGIGFAIPTHVVTDIVDDLRDGRVERGWLGVQIQPIDEDLAAALGVPGDGGALVVAADPEGPAANVLESRDVVTEVNGEPIDSPRTLSRTIAALDPGTTVDLTVIRDGSRQTVEVTLGLLPGDDATPPPPPPQPEPTTGALGLTLAPDERVGLGNRGVAIVEVDPEGVAAREGLQPGQVILEVGNQTVATPQDVAEAVSAARDAGIPALLLRVLFQGVEGYVALPLDDRE